MNVRSLEESNEDDDYYDEQCLICRAEVIQL